MKFAPLALVSLVALGLACGSDKAARVQGGPQFVIKNKKAAAPKTEDPYKSMTVENEVGVMDTDDVEATIQEHFGEVRDCYTRAGKAQRYAGGKVLLRFKVSGDGTTEDVLVLESTLGNYEVERCLVDVGRRIHFHAPNGNKPTTFEYPVEFRSTSRADVLDIDGPKVEHDLAHLLPQLAACGAVSDGQVQAIVWVEPNGVASSVGLATDAAVDEDAGGCVVQAIRGFRMSIGLPGHVVRANLHLPATLASAEASHRRHRHH
jgi:TonB family protein